MNQKILNWQLTAPQWDFFNSDAKYRAFISGIGAGKTAVGLMCGINEAIRQPKSVGVIVAPTYPLIRDVLYPEMEKWVPWELIKDFSRHENILTFKNGSVIRFRSAENDRQIERLRGPSITWFWIAEGTLLPKTTWDVMIGRVRQIGFNGKAWLTGTPKGFGWVYNLFIKTPIPNSFILSNVSSRSNVYLAEDYFRSLEEQYQGQFAAQELHGEFVMFEGLVYPGFTPDKIVREIPEHYDKVIYGVDWGFRNPSVILAIGVKDEKLYVLEEFYQTRVTDDELIDIASQMQKKWGVGTFYCDPSEPASIEKFKRAGIDARKGNNDVTAGIRAMTAKIEGNKFFVHERCQNTVNEFGMYSYPEEGRNRDAPLKLHDHAMDTCRYAIMGLEGDVRKSQIMTHPFMHIPIYAEGRRI
jgi:phage terminase large subunit